MRTYRSVARSRPRTPLTPRLQIARRSLSGEAVAAVPPTVRDTLDDPGHRLEPETLAFMEPRFDRDFSGVRLHTGPGAAKSARDLEARAYTSGDDIAFSAGEYDPSSPRGQHLLAHELAHVAQDRGEPAIEAAITSPGDASEIEADRAASAVFSGRTPEARTTPGAAIARQTPGPLAGPLAPTNAALPSQGEIVVESFLKRMWDKQSGGTEDFHVTPKVLEGLNFISPTLAGGAGVITQFKTPDEFLARIRRMIPATIDPNVLPVLDRLPNQEKKLADVRKTDPNADPAKPKFPEQAGGPPKSPEKPKDLSDAAAAALTQAYDQFSKTDLGKQLNESVKKYVLSAEGIPFDVIVAQGVIEFVAANDPKLPSIPEIPIGDGIKLKIDYSGRVSDLPPLVRDLVRGHSTQPQAPGKDEVKIGLSVTVTDDALVAMAKGVGHFFAEAAKWFAQGVIGIGTIIRKAGIHVGQALLAAVGGGALGALIGGLAAGGKGALIGAGIGAVFAAGMSVIGDLITSKPKKEQAA
jgi:hypothetical protein